MLVWRSTLSEKIAHSTVEHYPESRNPTITHSQKRWLNPPFIIISDRFVHIFLFAIMHKVKIRRGRSTIGHKYPGQDVLARTSEMGRPGQDFASCLRRPGQDIYVLLYFCPFVSGLSTRQSKKLD